MLRCFLEGNDAIIQDINTIALELLYAVHDGYSYFIDDLLEESYNYNHSWRTSFDSVDSEYLIMSVTNINYDNQNIVQLNKNATFLNMDEQKALNRMSAEVEVTINNKL